MRKRKEIESVLHLPISRTKRDVDETIIELLLDIRDLLISIDKPQVFLTPTQAVDELVDEVKKKYVKMCDACHVEMVFIKKYKNKSGAEFHTYQCPNCKGKIDYAQIKDVGEFSVHTNIIPEEAKKK